MQVLISLASNQSCVRFVKNKEAYTQYMTYIIDRINRVLGVTREREQKCKSFG